MIRRLLACAALLLPLSTAADDNPPDPQDEAALVTQIADVEAEHWDFTMDQDRPLERHPGSVLRWSNPNVGRVYGEVYVWTDRGCPAAVGSFYKWFTPYHDFTLEFKTLGRGTPTGRRTNLTPWQPASDDVHFQKLPDAPVPADQPAARLRQMRAFSGDFSVSLLDKRVSKIDGSTQELRCLTQPILRYESQEPEITDGAMFAFVNGTDPETLLLLETRSDGTARHWEYALARLNSDGLVGSYRETEIWRADPLQVVNDPRGAYTQLPGPVQR